MCLATPSASAGAEKAIWGPLTLPGGGSAFAVYRDLGVDTLQLAVDFASTAPTRPGRPTNPADPAYRWPAEVDRAITHARGVGMSIALVVQHSPPWANGGRSPIHAPNAHEFADFLTSASRRWPAVRRWMIWGEPDRVDRFQPNAVNSPVGPRAYAVMLDAAYTALKRASSSNIVIGGMTWTGGDVKPANFIRFLRLPNGQPPRLDWFGHNPFPFRFPDLRNEAILGGWRDISDLDTFSEELRQVYGRRVKLWLSEFSVQSDKASDDFTLFVSRGEQARWVGAAYGIADALDSVAGLGWLGLLDEPPRAGSRNWGLLSAGGARKPAYAAYRHAPSARYTPGVRVARRVRRARLRRGAFRVRVRPRLGGAVSVELRSSPGRLLAHAARQGSAGRAVRLKLRRRRARRCRCVLVVRAPRAATVRRNVTVR
jgi:hypothetical protein